MRKIILAIVIVITTSAVFAQNPIDKGQFQFNAGLGFRHGACQFMLVLIMGYILI
jgi:hypothetical protein